MQPPSRGGDNDSIFSDHSQGSWGSGGGGPSFSFSPNTANAASRFPQVGAGPVGDVSRRASLDRPRPSGPIVPQYEPDVPVQQLRGGLQTLVAPATGIASIYAVRTTPQVPTATPQSRHDVASPYETSRKLTLLEALREDERVVRDVEHSRRNTGGGASASQRGAEAASTLPAAAPVPVTGETIGMRLRRRMLDPGVEPWSEDDILAVARHVSQQKRREEEKLSEVL